MKKIATVLLVLVVAMFMAAPVLGATAGSSGSAYADWDIAIPYADAWAETDDGDEYVEVASYGMSEGFGEASSEAEADDSGEVAEGWTQGYCDDYCWTESDTYAEEDDEDGYTDADSDSYADGDYADAGTYVNAFWGPPIYSESDSWSVVEDGYAESSGHAIAEEP